MISASAMSGHGRAATGVARAKASGTIEGWIEVVGIDDRQGERGWTTNPGNVPIRSKIE
jgi:hypothetical protein